MAQPTPDPAELPSVAARVYAYTARFPNNLYHSFADLPMKDYIRLVWIVGAYILLRPYIEKGMQKWMAPDLDRLRETAEQARDAGNAVNADGDGSDAEVDGEQDQSIDPESGLPRYFAVKAGDIRSGRNLPHSTSTSTNTLKQNQNTSKNGGSGSGSKQKSSKKNKSNANANAKTSATDSSSSIEWGNSARRRQAAFVEAWEQEEARKLEEEDDEDLEDIDPVLLKGWDY